MKNSYKIEKRLFRLEFRKRKTPNEFTELHDACENLKSEIIKYGNNRCFSRMRVFSDSD